MCFAPQRGALSQHLNSQKWSDIEAFCTFLLRNVLRATAACALSTAQLPRVLRTWSVSSIWTSKCASHHNGVHFFAAFLPFRAPAFSFFWLFLFSDLLPSAFPSVHIVGSLTSKLPSISALMCPVSDVYSVGGSDRQLRPSQVWESHVNVTVKG